MKRYFLFLLPLLFACCKESVDTSTRYVFSENTIVSYMQNHADVYGEYLDLLGRVPVSRLSDDCHLRRRTRYRAAPEKVRYLVLNT